MDQLNLFQTIEIQGLRSTTAEISGEAIIEGNAIFAKGGAKIGNNLSENESSATMQSRQTSSKIIALKGLRLTKRPLVIDDFHYLPKDLQGEVVRAIKPLVYDGVPIVFIAIPHRRYDSVKVEREMTARMFLVDIPLWSSGELMFIPETGFPLMNVKLDPAIVWRLAQESLGSPHLMQEFCRAICRIHPNLSSGKSEQVTSEELEQAFRETAETIGRPIFEKLARGPRQRSDRLPRKLKDGEDVDIYELVLHGLAHIKPGLETIEYEDLRTAIKEICEAENVPQLHEIARVLKYMSEIAATDQSSTPVVDFDEADKLLHVTDPFFAFYLRWGRIG
ncbi:MAG: hypothetical protein KGL39_21130 [Patescibacteria group bacterium]|nr:hypothetical protein [Patescibacteria group bacterium]